MLNHGPALYEWIESGAYLYVCGAKEPMSVDVENTILAIAQLFGNKSTTEAQQWLDLLKEQGRYLKDVY
jgi:sulfite reductase (NADPH) flavoprotein alpha-component